MRARVVVTGLVFWALIGPAEALMNKTRYPLGWMVQHAEAIVLARSEASTTDHRVAMASVRERWKGKAPSSFVYSIVESWLDGEGGLYQRHTRSPEPLTVVLFLAATPDGERSASLLDWGVIELPERDVPAFRDCIRKGALTMERDSKNASIQPWLVGCASRRGTRAHALEDLTGPLAPSEQASIARGFVNEPSDDESFSSVLAAVGTIPDPEFDRVAVGVMDRVLSEPKRETRRGFPDGYPYWVVDAFRRIARRFCIEPELYMVGWSNQHGQVWPTSKMVFDAWSRIKRDYPLLAAKLGDVYPSHIDSGWAHLKSGW